MKRMRMMLVVVSAKINIWIPDNVLSLLIRLCVMQRMHPYQVEGYYHSNQCASGSRNEAYFVKCPVPYQSCLGSANYIQSAPFPVLALPADILLKSSSVELHVEFSPSSILAATAHSSKLRSGNCCSSARGGW